MAAVTGKEEPAVLHTLDGDSTVNSSSSQEHGAEEPKGREHPNDSAAASTNNEKHGSEDSQSVEMEQSIGVTKIEALYIVFGKGWKLVALWA